MLSQFIPCHKFHLQDESKNGTAYCWSRASYPPRLFHRSSPQFLHHSMLHAFLRASALGRIESVGQICCCTRGLFDDPSVLLSTSNSMHFIIRTSSNDVTAILLSELQMPFSFISSFSGRHACNLIFAVSLTAKWIYRRTNPITSSYACSSYARLSNFIR